MLLKTRVVILLVIVEIGASLVPNVTKSGDIENDIRKVETRRLRKKKNKKSRSTSSDEDRIVRSSGTSDKESLEISSEKSASSSSDDKNKPKSSLERKGWRKWHRKCQACPEDMAKKWRDPTIKWICGGYQRARRSFKSLCMMHYRNCQDGTMFVKIHDHRCADDTPRGEKPHGVHFFYDYRVALSDESSNSRSFESTRSDESSDDY